MLTECKQYTQSFEPDFSDLQTLCTNIEKINEKIIARTRKGKNELTSASRDDNKKLNRVSRGVDRAKQMIKTEKKS